jgi:hypothetical protein
MKFLLTLIFMVNLVYAQTWAGMELGECRKAHKSMNPTYEYTEAPFYDTYLYSVAGHESTVEYFYQYDTLTNLSTIDSHITLTYLTVFDSSYFDMRKRFIDEDRTFVYTGEVDTVNFYHVSMAAVNNLIYSHTYASDGVNKSLSLFKTKHGYLLIEREEDEIIR